MSAVCLYNSAAKRQPEPETPPSIGAGAGLREHLAIKDLREQGYDSGAIAKKAGLAPFIAKKSLAQASKFEKDTLRQAVEDCVETEAAVKSGRLGDRLGVELLIVKYSS